MDQKSSIWDFWYAAYSGFFFCSFWVPFDSKEGKNRVIWPEGMALGLVLGEAISSS